MSDIGADDLLADRAVREVGLNVHNKRLAAVVDEMKAMTVHELAAARVLLRRFELSRDNNYFNSARPRRHLMKFVEAAPDLLNGDALHGARILEFGSGTRNAVSVAALLIANGAASVVAYEPGAVNVAQSGLALQQLLLDLIRDPAASAVPGVEPEAVEERAVALLRGELAPPEMVARRDDLVTRPHGSFDLVLSNHVFEHVAEVESELQLLRRLAGARGRQLHRVDFRDHRVFSAKSTGLFDFYVDGELTTCNGWRPSDFRTAFARLWAVEERVVERADPASVPAPEDPRFTDYGVDELGITAIDYVLTPR